MKTYRIITMRTRKIQEYVIRDLVAKNKKEVREIYQDQEPDEIDDFDDETSEKILTIEEI